MKKLSKILSVGLSLAMCASLVAPALAVTYYIDQGNVYVESDGDGVYSYQGEGEKTYTSKDSEIIITGSTKENTITVGNGVTDTTITLSGVNIDVSGTGESTNNHSNPGEAAFSISGEASNVTVELDGKNTLQSGYERAGLELNDGASVVIQDTKGEAGSLKAVKGKEGGAGIGSGYDGEAGNITIDGGTVKAEGNSDGAAIGSGESGTVGNITINGGTVTADSEGSRGAGIGTGTGAQQGNGSKCGSITITGGDVTAKGGGNCAGIGTGLESTCEAITITGGIVKAIGSRNSAGIGSGYLASNNKTSNVAKITISGGKVTAIGGVAGSGIGVGVHYGNSADTSGSQVGGIDISNGNPNDRLELLALSLEGKGAYTNNGNLTGTVLSCRLHDSVSLDENSTFAVLDTEGNVVREKISVYVDGTAYRAFAIELRESDKDYVIAQKDKDGKIIGYLAEDDGEIVVFRAKTNGNSVTAVERDGLKLGDACPHGKTPATCEKCNPPEENPNPVDPDPVDPDPVDPDPVDPDPVDPDPVDPDPVDPDPVDPDPVVPDPTVEIDDVEVPLASGPVTRAEFIDYLWRHEGEPVADGVCTFADVAEDHEFALALAWAEEAGIAVADADGNFRPDDLLLRSTEDAEGELQEFLNRYAVYAGIGLEDGELFYELDGEPDGIIMGEEVLTIFGDFFAKLEAALAQKAA